MVLPDCIIAILIATVPILIAGLVVWHIDRKIDKAEPNYVPDFKFKNETCRIVRFKDGTYAIQKYDITYGTQHYKGIGREWVTLKKRYANTTDAQKEINRRTIEKVLAVFPQEYSTAPPRSE